MTNNFANPHNREPRLLRSQLLTPNPSPDSQSLNRHPKWLPFVHLLHNLILKSAPELRPALLELLEQADNL